MLPNQIHAIPGLEAPTPGSPRSRPVKPEDAPVLNRLRVWGARCRIKARSDLYAEVGKTLNRRSDGAEGAAVALFRVLPNLLPGSAFRLFEPGSAEMSFDESWLMAALGATGRGDTESLTFLLARRLPAHARRPVAMLIGRLAKELEELRT